MATPGQLHLVQAGAVQALQLRLQLDGLVCAKNRQQGLAVQGAEQSRS
ncbi:MAG: hypothetical protein AB1Z22_04190 [Synechococcaceae cyanobacterium]